MSIKFTGFIKKIEKNKYWIIISLIFFLHLFLRFYQLESRMIFGWDQVDNAWVAKNFIVDHKFPLVGMQAKLNSGISIGPLYYYLISVFYFLTNLDPIASGIFASVTSIFTFWVVYYIIKKLFSVKIAIIAIFINTVAFTQIIFDRVQWPVNFIPAISLIIFYSLYKIITGYPKYLILLSIVLGFSFHIHFTSIFYLPISIFAIPFFPRTKEMLKYSVISIFIVFVWVIPILLSMLNNMQSGLSFMKYGNTYYHGLHLTRVLQLFNDALIQFEKFLSFSSIKNIKFLLIPLFFIVYLYKAVSKEKLLLSYLIVLWFLIPWIIFSTYSGEISDYYFSINKFIALFIIAYIFTKIFEIKNILPKIVLSFFLIYYAVFNITSFLSSNGSDYQERKQKVLKAVKEGKKIQFQEGVPESYLYYIYTRDKK